jgi:hypothetical protein
MALSIKCRDLESPILDVVMVVMMPTAAIQVELKKTVIILQLNIIAK